MFHHLTHIKSMDTSKKDIQISDIQKNSMMEKIYNSDIYKEFLRQWGNPNSQILLNHKSVSISKNR